MQPSQTEDALASAPAQAAPAAATEAVFKVSEQIPPDAVAVQGIDFDHYQGRDITVNELVGGLSRMGFQASGLGEAVRIVNDMVGPQLVLWLALG